MPFAVFFMSHTDLLQSLLPPLLEDGRRADVGTGPGLENQPDNFEDRLADIKDLQFSTALSRQKCHRRKMQLISTNRPSARVFRADPFTH